MKDLKVNNSKIDTERHCLNKFQLFQDLNLEEKVKKAEDLIKKENQARQEIVRKIEERKFEQNDFLIQLKHLPWEYGICAIGRRTKAIQYLQQVLHQRHLVELECNEHIIKMNRLFHRLQHGGSTLVVEKKIFEAIKFCANERREKVLTDTNTKSKHQWCPWDIKEVMKSKQPIEEIIRSDELIKEQIQLLFREQEGLRKQKLAYNSKERMLRKGLEAAEKDINSLERKLEDVNRRKVELYAYILELKKCVGDNVLVSTRCLVLF